LSICIVSNYHLSQTRFVLSLWKSFPSWMFKKKIKIFFRCELGIIDPSPDL
jgi:hypothetical protein